MRDALIIGPVSVALLGLIGALNEFLIGATHDLIIRWIPIYFAAWLMAWGLIATICQVPLLKRLASSFSRCVAIVVLFWPILAVGSCLAEEWTLSHRVTGRNEPSDMGNRYMYGELSGMGQAGGWMDLSRKVSDHCLGGLVASIVWLPVLFASALFWRRVLGDMAPVRSGRSSMTARDHP
jgi:hypothetical protein